MTDENVFRKVSWRLVPFLMLLYFVSYVDRVNIGFAAPTMNVDLGFSATVYGFGAGIFFLGYFLFEVPSNIILARVGARRWIFRIMITWGVISAGMAFVQDAVSFYVLRFLLGAAEAGFFPGIIFYLTFWYPREYRARLNAIFLSAIPIANIIGGPLAGVLLGLDGAGGLHGWQWLFVIEGIPACLLAFAVLYWLPDRPAVTSWLSSEEKSVIARRLAAEPPPERHTVWAGLSDQRIWLLGFVLAGIVTGIYAINLWLPLIVSGMGFNEIETGFIVALPYMAGGISMLLWSRRSDRRGERVWHVVGPVFVGAAGFLVAALVENNALLIVSLIVAMAGAFGGLGPFWSLPPMFLRGTAAASGFALMNSIGAAGGFFGPFIVGWLRDQTGGYDAGMVAIALSLVFASLIVLVLARAFGPRAALAGGT